MISIRAAFEGLLLFLLGTARAMFLFQGLAFACASAAVFVAGSPEAPGWLRDVMVSALLLSGTFVSAGLLMIAARRWRVRDTGGGGEPVWPWPLGLGISLLALPVVAAIGASGLPTLWSSIATHLSAIGAWEEVTRPGPGAIVLLPILVALFVPALLTAAAVVSVLFPPALIPLLSARSRLFPTILAMGVICQAALVITGWIAANAFARLAAQVMASMTASGDREVLQVAAELDSATSLLTGTALGLVVPMVGMLAWVVFLRASGAAAAYFHVETTLSQSDPVPEPPVADASHLFTPVAPAAERRTPADRNVAIPARPPVPGSRYAGRALAALGAFMLLFGGADALRTRASYVSSQPAPGAMLAGAPGGVRVTFRAALDPASTLSLTRLVVQPADGEQPLDVPVTPRIAPDDPGSRTIEALPSGLSAGVYRVAWRALPAGGGVPRSGSFSFGIGVPVPEDEPGFTHSLQDRDAGARGRRQTFLGGVLLLVLGALLPRLTPRA